MSSSKVFLGPLQKRILYISTAALWFSGAVWLVLSETTSTRPLWLKIHGAAAMLFLMVFGTLVANHLPAGWRQKRQRPSGSLVTALCGMLMLTGWGLYYVGNDALRHGISLTHSALGLGMPLLIFIHVRWGRRTFAADIHDRMGSKKNVQP